MLGGTPTISAAGSPGCPRGGASAPPRHSGGTWASSREMSPAAIAKEYQVPATWRGTLSCTLGGRAPAPQWGSLSHLGLGSSRDTPPNSAPWGMLSQTHTEPKEGPR